MNVKLSEGENEGNKRELIVRIYYLFVRMYYLFVRIYHISFII